MINIEKKILNSLSCIKTTTEISKFIDGSILTIYDHPWPGFTPDLLSIIFYEM